VSQEPLLALEGVTKRFGGPNGSGKTTLINLIGGFYALDGGAIILDGHHLEQRPAHAMAALGVVRTFQLAKAFSSMTLLENLLVPVAGDHRRESLDACRARALDALEHVDLHHMADRQAAALSGGQTMLLQLARALVHEPIRLLLLDEPFAGVAPALKQRMVATIGHLNRERGATVLLVSHEMSTVRDLCERVVVMNLGRLIAQGGLADVVNDRDVIDAYLGKPI
jgi:ABC-type branched-subunit amino acid transport system ATPase component